MFLGIIRDGRVGKLRDEIDQRCSALFTDVNPVDVETFLASSRRVEVGRGDFLFTGLDDHGYLYVLLSGTVKTFVVTPTGREQIIHLFFPGDVFGGLLFGKEQVPRPWARAVDPVRAIALDEADFRRLMGAAPKLCVNILNYMVVHHHQDLRRLQTMIHTRASHRLVMTLLHLGERQGGVEEDRCELRVGLTHEDYANMIGVVRSTVSELMSTLRERGVVSGSRRCLSVSRRAAERFLEES